MLRLLFVELHSQQIMLDFINPPALPIVGDVTEGPDGTLYVVAARAFLVTAPSKIIELSAAGTKEPEVIVRCTIVEMSEDGSVRIDATEGDIGPVN